MNVVVNITGPVTVTVPSSTNLEEKLSALSDAVAALVAEDGVVKTALDDLAAKVAAGTATAQDAADAQAAITSEVSNLQGLVAADDPSAAPVSPPSPPAPEPTPAPTPVDPTPAPVDPTPAPVDPTPAPDPAPAAPVVDPNTPVDPNAPAGQ